MQAKLTPVRLNLTAANYVHIVEPQWNPSVEEQAIARAVRMGQKRIVAVIRYVVKNSVEEVRMINIFPHVVTNKITEYREPSKTKTESC